MNIRRFITTAVVCATTLIMVGCDAQSNATAPDTDAKKTIITAYDVEPQNPLTPGDSGESAGIRVSDQNLFRISHL